MSAAGSLPSADSAEWLMRFHAGDRQVIAQIYREHGATITRVVGAILSGPDREGVIHDIFLQLIESEEMRRKFQGGSISAWLRQVARNRALDTYRRRSRRQELVEEAAQEADVSEAPPSPERAVEAAWVNKLVERFTEEVLPAKWHRVFEVRFVKQLSQRDAAKVIGISRTTLAYQETRVRHLLRKFMLQADARFLDDAR